MKKIQNKLSTAMFSLLFATSTLSIQGFAAENVAQNSSPQLKLETGMALGALSYLAYRDGSALKKQSETEGNAGLSLERKVIAETKKPFQEELNKLETPETVDAEKNIEKLRVESRSLSRNPVDTAKNVKRLTQIEREIEELRSKYNIPQIERARKRVVMADRISYVNFQPQGVFNAEELKGLYKVNAELRKSLDTHWGRAERKLTAGQALRGLSYVSGGLSLVFGTAAVSQVLDKNERAIAESERNEKYMNIEQGGSLK